MIKGLIPEAVCVKNKVPKAWSEKDIYCQMVANEDDNNPYYDQVPRIGAFEVSTVIGDTDILLYSKMMSSMWPHAEGLSTRCKELAESRDSTAVTALKAKYQTTG